MRWTGHLLTLGAGFLLIVPVLAILSSRGALTLPSTQVTAAQPQPRAIDGELATVVRGPLTRGLASPGVVAPVTRVKLGFEHPGTIKELTVQAGDRVKAGDVLAKLDTARLEIELQQADAALALARARRDALKAGTRGDEIAVAKAALEAAQARLDAAKEPVSPARVSEAKAQVASEEAALKSARTATEAARTGDSALAPLLNSINDLRGRVRAETSPTPDSLRALQSGAQALLPALDSLGSRSGASATEVDAAHSATDAAKIALDQALAGPNRSDLLLAQAALDAANATVAQAQAQQQKLKSGATTAEVVQSMHDVDTARQNAERAETEYRRLSQWRPNPQDIQLAQLALQAAQAQLDDALATYGTVSQQVGDADHPEAIAAASRISTTGALLETARTRVATLANAPSSADQQAADTALKARQAELATAQAKLAKLRGGATSADFAAAQQVLDAAQALQKTAQARLDQLRAGPDQAAVALAQRTYDAVLSRQRAVEAANARGAGVGRADEIANARTALTTTVSVLAGAVTRPETAANALRTADGNLASVQATLDRLRAASRQAEIAAAESSAAASESGLLLAKARLDTLEAGPRPSEIANAQAGVNVARAYLDLLQGLEANDAPAANEEVRQAEAALDLAQLRMLSSILVAPFDGVIASLDAGRGGYVSGPFVALADVREPRVVANLPAQTSGALRLGQEVTIGLDLVPGSSFAGRVAALPQFAADDGTFPVTFQFLNPSDSIKLGMQATVRGAIVLRDNAVLVPTAALRGEGSFRSVDVWSASRASTREARVGIVTEDWTEVLSGLDEGERVVVYKSRPR